MADTTLRLGDFLFESFEIPSEIKFGGNQKLVTHQLVGGSRVVDAMGRNDMPLSWSGMFLGQSALDRARYVDYLRTAGQPLNLLWSEFNYSVVIEHFECSFERFYKLPYSISCLVVQDNTKPNTTHSPAGFDAAITGDAATADTLTASIGDSALIGLMGTLDTAISAVSTFSSAAQATINSVLTPLAAVQGRVNVLVTSVSNTVQNVTTIGGILPNKPVAQSANNLIGQVAALNQLPKLYNLQSVLNRMGGNLGLIHTAPGGQSIVTSGGNLFALAQKYYGDATKWTSIALANGLTDPQLAGTNTLTIPANPPATDGVYVK
jgi:prophage DNA circulation protein